MISRYAGDVHLDTDAVLVGELAFAPFDRFIIFGRDIGPRGLYLMLGILIINTLFITIFYKELKITTFDAGLAAALGFVPTLMHYGLMSLVSLTIVGAGGVERPLVLSEEILSPSSGIVEPTAPPDWTWRNSR